MKQMISIWSAAFLALTVFSCSPVAYVESDPSVNLGNYNTYAWVESKSAKDEDASNPSAFAKLSIQNAVNEQLRKQGWQLVTSDPDVLVSYDILVEKGESPRDEAVYTRPFIRYYYNPWFRRWGTIYYPSRFMGYESYSLPFREANVTISMMDAETDKKIWQGWTTQQMKNRLMTKGEIRSSVRSIFNKFGEGA